MPELPEAESIARTLDARLRGRGFSRALVLRRDVLHVSRPDREDLPLAGRRIEGVLREGKRVVIGFADGAKLVFALGMTGRLTVEPVDQPPATHTHLRISIEQSDEELRFRDPRRFGGVWFLDGTGRDTGRALSALGVDPLAVKAGAFRAILGRNRQIKALLMDQRVIAGLGNIYCDEALHRAGVHPQRRANILTSEEVTRLLRGIRSVLREAIRCNGSTLMDYRNADGAPGSFQRRHRVYNREGKPCKSCETPIVRITAAGRGTHFCPGCQEGGIQNGE